MAKIIYIDNLENDDFDWEELESSMPERRTFSTKKAAVEDRKSFRHLFKSNAEMDRAMPIKKYSACYYGYSAPIINEK